MSEASSSQIQSAPVGSRSARFIITAELDGFPVVAEVEGKADGLKAMVERMKAIGAVPPQKAAVTDAKPNGAPVCPVHHTPMKASRKPGSYFCPRQTDDGAYCPHKA